MRLFIQAKLLKVNEICLLIRVNKAQFSLEWVFICQKIQRYKMAKKAFFVFTSHGDLKSDSHKRFGNRDFACWAYILDYGESKKDCLN